MNVLRIIFSYLKDHKTLIVACLALLTLGAVVFLPSNRAYAACSPSPICADNLYPTGNGVPTTPPTTTNYDASRIDPNYYVSALYNTCDHVADSNDDGYGDVYAVDTYSNNGTGTNGTHASARPLQPSQHPWYAGGGGGSWIGLSTFGWDLSGGGYPQSYYLNAAAGGCVSPSDAARGGAADPAHFSQYTFSTKQKFAVHKAADLDPTSIKLSMTGGADNIVSVWINGCALTAQDYRATYGDGKSWSQPPFQYDKPFRFDLGSCPLNTDGANDNTLDFQLLSTYDLTGFRISSIKLTADTTNPGPGPTGNCPGDPNFDSSSRDTLSTPFVNPDGTSAPGGTTSSYGNSVNQDTGIYNDNFNSVDTSSGGTRYAPPITGYNSNKTTVTVYPSAFATNYPYDPNSADVTYNTEYNLTVWSATVYNHQQCDGGGSLGGGANGCGTYTVSDGSPGCATYVKDKDGNDTSTCATYNACPNEGTAPACYHTNSYPAPTNYYSYAVASGPSATSRSATSSAYTMTPCYNRGFSMSGGSATISLDSNEDPTKATSTGNGTVSFSKPEGGDFRNTPTVTLQYQDSYSGGDANCNLSGPLSTGPGGFSETNSCGAHAPPLEPGDTVCVNWQFSPTGYYVDVNGKPQSSVDPSANTSNGAGNGDSTSDSACTQPVTDNPYAHFFVNDVAAGGAFASGNDQCASENQNGGGSILAELESASRGSGDQFGALALGSSGGGVSGFASASLRNSPPLPPNGLKFASDGTNLGISSCVPDYYGMMPAGATAINSSSFAIDSTSNGSYFSNGDLTLNTSGVTDGHNVVIYVNGNVTITGDVVYQTNGWSLAGNTTNIPSLYIIAKGNINISGSVNELDGVYVAQPSYNSSGNYLSGGTINTCNEEDYGTCNNQLTVYGSFIDQKTELYRTKDSLRDSYQGEHPGSLPNTTTGCDTGDSSTPSGAGISKSVDCAAELFIFSPANYLGQPALPPTGGPNVGKFDAISSLSPVL